MQVTEDTPRTVPARRPGADETTAPHVVTATREVGAGVVEVTLARQDGEPVSGWTPGAHIELHTPSGPRQYSLCGPRDEATWTIAVLREEAGRGGSAWVHGLGAGDVVEVTGPRNHFALDAAPSYVFVAGGIGITPILAMLDQADREGREWVLHYGGRSRASMAYADRLRTAHPSQVHLHPQDVHGHLDLGSILDAVAPRSLVYACGPGGLLDAVEEECTARDLLDRLHVERFEAREPVLAGAEHAFEVELSYTGVTLAVPTDRSVLSVLEEAGVDVLSSCAEGTCGTCETPVLEGEVDHRDSILSASERARNEVMYVCCSRAAAGCSRLVLDL